MAGRDHDPSARLRAHRYGALVGSLSEEASWLTRPMFGCLACYLHGRFVLLLADRRPPWRGLVVPTDRARQPALRAEIPALTPHPVIGKWLLLAESDDDFEPAAEAVVALIQAGDARIGVEPTTRVRRRSSPRGGRTVPPRTSTARRGRGG